MHFECYASLLTADKSSACEWHGAEMKCLFVSLLLPPWKILQKFHCSSLYFLVVCWHWTSSWRIYNHTFIMYRLLSVLINRPIIYQCQKLANQISAKCNSEYFYDVMKRQQRRQSTLRILNGNGNGTRNFPWEFLFLAISQ